MLQAPRKTQCDSGILLRNNSITNTIGHDRRRAQRHFRQRKRWHELQDSNNNVIEGNYIGTNATGDDDLGNTGAGILISGNSQSNKIGDTVAGAAM